MPKNEILLIGGGGHCCSVIDVIEHEGKYTIAGIIDLREKIGQKILNYPIIADDSSLPNLIKEYKYYHITIGFIKDPFKRIQLYNYLIKIGASFPKIVSPQSYVSKHSSIGFGTVIMHNAQVNPNVHIGENCIINSKSLIEHDANIGNHCHISTGAIINGNVEIGDESLIGSGAVIIQGAKVSVKSFIKAGSIFIRR